MVHRWTRSRVAEQVPRSAKMVTEDNEYALYSFILFRKIVDSYKSEARQKGWQVSLCCCRVMPCVLAGMSQRCSSQPWPG